MQKVSTPLTLFALFALFGLGAQTAFSQSMPADQSMPGHDMHQHHHAAAEPGKDVKRSMVDIKVSAIKMVRQDGQKTDLQKELADNKPTVVAFIYTSCTTICPVTSQLLASTQELLGSEMGKVRFMSVSIDPEYDTPKRLAAYAKKYGAEPSWQHYGGTLADSVAIQKAFGAYRGDKMNHVPLLFVNGGGKKQWLRLDGFPLAEDLVKDLHEQQGS